MEHIRKISSILLALLVLVSSTSFTLSTHFCMGELQSIAIFSAAEPCEMTLHESPSQSEKHDPDCDHKVTNNSCCKDHLIVVEGSEEMTVSPSSFLPDLQEMVVFIAISYLEAGVPQKDAYSFKDYYSPPLIELDIPVMVQSFLI